MQISTYIRAVFGIFAVAAALVPAAQATTLTASERSVLAAVNDVRQAHRLRPLGVDPALVRAARAHSTTLMERDAFTHGALGERLAEYGVRGPVYGENLAWGTGSRATAASIVHGWMTSSGHRANLLRPGWTRIGIGWRVGSFRGYGGAVVLTADFAGH
jgi:uncharacterized protein YkwD